MKRKKTSKESGAYYLGEMPFTVCWIPDDCLISKDGVLTYNEEEYKKRMLHIENMRENIHGIGGHLFPHVPLIPATEEDIITSRTSL